MTASESFLDTVLGLTQQDAKNGWPDRVVELKDQMVAIEYKLGHEKLRPEQRKRLTQLVKAGWTVIVVRVFKSPGRFDSPETQLRDLTFLSEKAEKIEAIQRSLDRKIESLQSLDEYINKLQVTTQQKLRLLSDTIASKNSRVPARTSRTQVVESMIHSGASATQVAEATGVSQRYYYEVKHLCRDLGHIGRDGHSS